YRNQAHALPRHRLRRHVYLSARHNIPRVDPVDVDGWLEQQGSKQLLGRALETEPVRARLPETALWIEPVRQPLDRDEVVLARRTGRLQEPGDRGPFVAVVEGR